MDRLLGSVLATIVVGIGLIGLYSLFPGLLSSNQTDNILALNTSIYACVRDLYQNQGGNYGSAIITSQLTSTPNCLASAVNGYGGAITVTTNGTNFFVDQDNVPKGACIKAWTKTQSGGGTLQIGAAAAGTTPGSLSVVGSGPAVAIAACANDPSMMRFQMQ